MSTANTDETLTLQEVANQLGVHLTTIERRMKVDPDFQTFRVGRARRMTRAALQHWIALQEQKARRAAVQAEKDRAKQAAA